MIPGRITVFWNNTKVLKISKFKDLRKGIKNRQECLKIFSCELYFGHLFQLEQFNPTPQNGSNALKLFVGNLPGNCFNVFDHFLAFALKGLKRFLY